MTEREELIEELHRVNEQLREANGQLVATTFQAEDQSAEVRRQRAELDGIIDSIALIEAQGGRIWVESSAGEGSTFYFTLPAVRWTIVACSRMPTSLQSRVREGNLAGNAQRTA